MLGIVDRTIAMHMAHKAGLRKKDVTTGAVTVIQRFGSDRPLAYNVGLYEHVCDFRHARVVSWPPDGFAH